MTKNIKLLSRSLTCVFCFGICFSFVSQALGQVASVSANEKKVAKFNQEAMDFYTNLDIDNAKSRLEDALSLIEKKKLGGKVKATTYLNLGIVMMGGFGDQEAARKYFREGLLAFREAKLDLQFSTPDVQAVFVEVRASLPTPLKEETAPEKKEFEQIKEMPTKNGPDEEKDSDLKMVHKHAVEQLKRTPVPVYVETPEGTEVGTISLFFKSTDQVSDTYEKVKMEPMDKGYGVLIPCWISKLPSVEYYITVMDKKGKILTKIGSAKEPTIVPIVAQRSRPAAALPGKEPPASCPEGKCAEGEKLCADIGQACASSSQCFDGLACTEQICTPVEEDPAEKAPRFFAQIGVGLGAGLALKGMPADSAPPSSCVIEGPDGTRAISESPECLKYLSYVPGTDPSCSADDDAFCTRVASEGLIFTPSLNIATGYYILPRLGVGATFRYQFDGGKGTLANILIGIRAQYLFTEPSETGFNAAAALGTSVGQIQLKVDQNGDVEPYVISGLHSMDVGAVLGYRFLKYVGVNVTPQLHFMFPSFLFAFESSIGVEGAF